MKVGKSRLSFSISDLPTTLIYIVVALFIGFNFFQIASLIRDRLNARLPEADAQLLEALTGTKLGPVEKALLQVPGVQTAVVNLVTEIASVECDASVDPRYLSDRLTTAGFPSQARSGAGFQAEIDQGLQSLADLRQQQAKRHSRDLAIAITLLVASSLGHVIQMLGWTVPALTNDWLHGALALATLLVPGRPILVEGFQGLRRNAPNMNTLIALGAVTAFVTSAIALIFPQLNWECFFAEPVMLIGFILLGRTLEQRARNRAARWRHHDIVAAPSGCVGIGSVQPA